MEICADDEAEIFAFASQLLESVSSISYVNIFCFFKTEQNRSFFVKFFMGKVEEKIKEKDKKNFFSLKEKLEELTRKDQQDIEHEGCNLLRTRL